MDLTGLLLKAGLGDQTSPWARMRTLIGQQDDQILRMGDSGSINLSDTNTKSSKGRVWGRREIRGA